MLQPNEPAPGFTLSAGPGQEFSLESRRGKNVILAFYPADFSPVCSDQMALYNEMLSYFQQYNAEMVGISVDSKWCHQAFTQSRNLHFRLLADFEPKGEVARKYGVYNAKKGQSNRALFVIDGEGMIRWSYLSPDGENPGADGILEALENLNKQLSA